MTLNSGSLSINILMLVRLKIFYLSDNVVLLFQHWIHQLTRMFLNLELVLQSSLIILFRNQ